MTKEGLAQLKERYESKPGSYNAEGYPTHRLYIDALEQYIAQGEKTLELTSKKLAASEKEVQELYEAITKVRDIVRSI